jgi:hypothetical protein
VNPCLVWPHRHGWDKGKLPVSTLLLFVVVAFVCLFVVVALVVVVCRVVVVVVEAFEAAAVEWLAGRADWVDFEGAEIF